MTGFPRVNRLLPGLALSSAIAAVALALDRAERAIWGNAWLEALVLAIVLGSLVRTLVALPASLTHGVRFAAKPVMESAVVLMGASVSLFALAGAGPLLVGAIAATIAVTIALSYRLGRWLGLSQRMAILVACGNAICGNSAIAAVAPVIQAENEDVAASVGFTAVMGIFVVIAVAPVAKAIGLTPGKGGILAGMMVYAVPQVLAAANPLGGTAVQVGALVKLIRVLMLGPVVSGLSLIKGTTGQSKPNRYFPGFIVLFMALAALHSLHAIPDDVASAARETSLVLTVIAMAGLGLGVDLRGVARAGPGVVASVFLSLAVLFSGALVTIQLAG